MIKSDGQEAGKKKHTQFTNFVGSRVQLFSSLSVVKRVEAKKKERKKALPNCAQTTPIPPLPVLYFLCLFPIHAAVIGGFPFAWALFAC
jgi:hypothetical protein